MPQRDEPLDLEALFVRNAERLRSFFEAHTFDLGAADELVNQTFVKLAADDPLPRDLERWIWTQARLVLADFYRQEAGIEWQAETVSYGLKPPEITDLFDDENLDTGLLDAELKEQVSDAILALPEREKLVIALCNYENLTEREVGDLLGVTEEGIRDLHSQALRSLSAHLELYETAGRSQPTVLGPDGEPLSADSAERARFDLAIAEISEEFITQLAEHSELMYELSSRRFEELITELYLRRGFEAFLTPASGDGGVDIWVVRHGELGSSLTAVQCKRNRPSNKVGVGIVRELRGTLEDAGASSGVVMTTSYFTRGARAFEQRHQFRLALHDYFALQELLRLPRVHQKLDGMVLPRRPGTDTGLPW